MRKLSLLIISAFSFLFLFSEDVLASVDKQAEGVYSYDVSEVEQFKIPIEYFASAFEWDEKGSFEYSWDGLTYKVATENHEDEYHNDEEQHVDGDNHLFSYTDLDFNNSYKTLYLRNINTETLNLILIDPYSSVNMSVNTYSLSAVPAETTGGFININSGASYTELDIVNRTEWGADENITELYPQYREIEKFIVHHTAWENDPGDYAATVRAIHLFHTVTRGWFDIGYNYLIAPDGTIFEGRRGGEGVIGAHTYMYNSKSIGISFMGNFTNQRPTEEALESFKNLLVERSIIHNVDLIWSGAGETVFGHRHFSNTQCPGEELFQHLPTMISDAKTLRDEVIQNSLIEVQRQNTELFFQNYDDVRLEVVFEGGPYTSEQIDNMLPSYSGIRRVLSYTESSAVIEVESFAYYGNELFDDTNYRLRFLHLVLSLNPSVTEIRKVDIPELLRYSPQEDNAGMRNILEFKFSENVNIGSGNLLIKKVSDDSIFETINVQTADITVTGDRQLEVAFNNTMVEGERYYVEICSTCFIDDEGNSYPGLTDKSAWQFTNVLQWTDWVESGGRASAPVAMAEFNERIYQVVRGDSFPYKIWIRSSESNDLVFDGDPGENWSDEINGRTSKQASLAVFEGRLYLAVRGNSGNIFTKSMGTDEKGNEVWDDTWNENGGATGTAIGMASVDFGDGKEERLYQVIRGRSTNYIYVRYTLDGTFDGGEGEEWEKIWGKTPNAIGVTAMNGNLYMSVRGNSGEIWNRYTNDGVWDGDEAGENFVQNGGKTSEGPVLQGYNGKLYQSIKGNSTNYIYLRYNDTDLNWSDWVKEIGSTQMRPELMYSAELDRLISSIVSIDGSILTRSSI